MSADPRYAEGVRLFQDGHFFEAHEVLEGAWRETPRGPTRELLQGLIQLAVSLEHWRRGNPRGARGQLEKATRRLEPLPPVYAGLRLAELVADVRAFFAERALDDAVEAQREGRFQPRDVEAWPVPRWERGGGRDYGE